jgi:hypothetical protein
MQPITAPAPCPVTVPAPIVAAPGKARMQRRDGPLRSGRPRGNPNQAPRCGAKARTTGLACRAPAMANGRCRMHGGRSTGPRTPEGLAGLAAARTTHGLYAQAGPDAEIRAEIRHARVVGRRSRLTAAALAHLPWLPPALAARLRADAATELHAPMYYARLPGAPVAETAEANAGAHATGCVPPPGHGPGMRRDARGRFAPAPRRAVRGRKAEQARARAEAAALAPWKAAIARARMSKRLTMDQDRAARLAKLGHNPMQRLPPGTGPAGGTVRPDAAVDAGLGSVAGLCRDGTLGQGARSAGPGQKPIQRGTERADGAAAGLGSVLGHGARCAEPGQKPIQRGTERADGANAGAGTVLGQGGRSAGPGQKPIQRGTERADGAAAGAGSVLGQGVRCAGPGQKPIQRGTERSGGMDAGSGSVLGQGVRCAGPGQKPIQRGTERPDGADAWSGSVLGQRARSAGPGQKPIQRGTERSGGMDAGSGAVLGQGARSAGPGQDPMQRGTVMRPTGPGGRKAQAATKTPCNRTRWGSGLARKSWMAGRNRP